MEELKTILWDYYGQLNELRLNIKIKPEDRVWKPEALIRYDQARDLGIPYVAGGLMDQPYYWMQEHGMPPLARGVRNTGEQAMLVPPGEACGAYIGFVGPE